MDGDAAIYGLGGLGALEKSAAGKSKNAGWINFVGEVR